MVKKEEIFVYYDKSEFMDRDLFRRILPFIIYN
jgi:hypothetical protein